MNNKHMAMLIMLLAGVFLGIIIGLTIAPAIAGCHPQEQKVCTETCQGSGDYRQCFTVCR